MTLYGPLETMVEMVERLPHFVDLMIKNRPGVRSYQLYAHKSLNDAYGNPAATGGGNSGVAGAGAVAFTTVDRGMTRRSATIRRRGLGILDENRRGMSRVVYDPSDFVGAAFSPDEEFVYIRVQEWDPFAGQFREVLGVTNNTDPVLGPIYILPRSGFFNARFPTMMLAGLAPANTGATEGALPPLHVDGQNPSAMHFVLPRAADDLRIRNTHATQDMLIAFGLGQPMARIPAGEEYPIFDGSVKHILVASTDNGGGGAVAPTFSGYASVGQGR